MEFFYVNITPATVTAMLALVLSTTVVVSVLAGGGQECEHRFTGVSTIKIIYPLEGQRITVDRHQDKSECVLRIQAEHTNDNALVSWYLNGNDIGTTVKEHNLIIQLKIRWNTILLVDENEESASTFFYVAEEEVSQ